MKKQEFLRSLKKKLSRLPRKDVDERLNFYSEMIDDRVEEGLSEEEAVMAVGSINEIADQSISSIADEHSVGGKANNKKLKAWELTLLIVGAPVWLPVLIAVFAVIWSLVITLWAVELPFLIFYYISKYLFVACKVTTVLCYKITKKTVLSIKALF